MPCFSSLFIYRASFMLQIDFDFASWMTVLLRYTFWSSTLTLLICFEPFVKHFRMFDTCNDRKIYYQATEQ